MNRTLAGLVLALFGLCFAVAGAPNIVLFANVAKHVTNALPF